MSDTIGSDTIGRGGDSSGGGFETFIRKVTLGAGAASIGFADISQDYDDILYIGRLRTNRASTNDNCNISMNSNVTAASYSNQFLRARDNTNTTGGEAISDPGAITIVGGSATANSFTNVKFRIPYYTKTDQLKMCEGDGRGIETINSIMCVDFRVTSFNSSAAVTAIDFTPNAGTEFTTGSELIEIGIKYV